MTPATGLDRSDLRFWGMTFGPLLAAVAALYATAFLLAPPHYRFSGFLLGTADSYSYLYWARSFADQGLLVDVPTSLTPQPGAYFNLVWYVFGQTVKHTGIPFLVLYYGFGIVAGGAMYLLLLLLMKTLVRDRLLARTAYLMAGFGTGLGWLVFLFSHDMVGGTLIPADIVHGDGFPIYAFWTFPHVSFSWCLLLASALLLFREREGFRAGPALGLAAIALVAGFSHPYQVLILLPVFGFWYLLLGLKRGRVVHARWGNLLAYAAGAAPAMWFYYDLVHHVPAFAFLADFVYRTFPPLGAFFGYATFLVPAAVGYRGFFPLRPYTDRYLLMSAWAIVGAILPYTWPLFHNEGKLNQGWLIPLSVFGSWGLGAALFPRVFGAQAPAIGPDIYAAEEAAPPSVAPPVRSARRLAVLAVAGAVLFLPSTGLLMLRQMKDLLPGDPGWFRFTDDPKMIIHEDELRAMRWMDRELKGRPLVLAGRATGLVLPGQASVRVFWGHQGNALQHNARLKEVMAFLNQSATSEARREFLRKYPFEWLYWGPDEQAFYGNPPAEAELLEMVYRRGMVRIFRVRRERLS